MIKAPSKDPAKRVRKIKIFGFLSRTFTVLGILLILLSVGPFIQQEALFYLSQLKDQKFVLIGNPSAQVPVTDSPFARLISTRPIELDPVNRDFALVIEKIGVNVPVVKDVSVNDTDAYMVALEKGVAHAVTSGYPSKSSGNVYIFAHASLNFWRLGKYATVFNLLRHLNEGDAIHVFYENRDFVYKVVGVERFKGFDTYPLTRPVLEPLLTLQTCDPPGTTLNRLVVTAKLMEVR
jgi:LPXTG-site transpeptidase (sortase) family protein